VTRPPLYLEPRQAGTRTPAAWENELADVLEESFAAGIHELDALLAALNRSRVRPPAAAQWTAENFQSIIRDLGAE